jgi:hypothetical protein
MSFYGPSRGLAGRAEMSLLGSCGADDTPGQIPSGAAEPAFYTRRHSFGSTRPISTTCREALSIHRGHIHDTTCRSGSFACR